MTLTLTPLHNAIQRLKEAVEEYNADPLHTLLRDGLVQRFEFTYEQCHITMRRYLGSIVATGEKIERLTFPDLIRTANQYDLLLGDWPAWHKYREMRAKTSHTYDEVIALEVIAGIPAFLAEAEYLAATIQERLGK